MMYIDKDEKLIVKVDEKVNMVNLNWFVHLK